jgi:hypothetical protein
MKLLLGTLVLLAAFPAACQNLTAILRVNGNVMVDGVDGFVSAKDRQPVIVGQRIMVGDNARATVVYSRDCERTFSDAGIHTVGPANCSGKERERSQDNPADESVAEASGAAETLQTIGILVGSVALGATEISQQDETPVPVSR